MKKQNEWIREVFDRAAPQYGEKDSSFFTYFGKRLVEQAKVEPYHHVLDVGTGKGAILFPLTKIINSKGKITGIDVSEQMLSETSVRLAKKGVNRVDLLRMDAENLCFPENSFDFVFCGFCFSFFLSPFPSSITIQTSIKTWREFSFLYMGGKF